MTVDASIQARMKGVGQNKASRSMSLFMGGKLVARQLEGKWRSFGHGCGARRYNAARRINTDLLRDPKALRYSQTIIAHPWCIIRARIIPEINHAQHRNRPAVPGGRHESIST